MVAGLLRSVGHDRAQATGVEDVAGLVVRVPPAVLLAALALHREPGGEQVGTAVDERHQHLLGEFAIAVDLLGRDDRKPAGSGEHPAVHAAAAVRELVVPHEVREVGDLFPGGDAAQLVRQRLRVRVVAQPPGVGADLDDAEDLRRRERER